MIPELLGQGETWDQLVALADSGQLPHAVLIEGAPGAGKSLAVSLLAARLLARDPSEVDASFVDRMERGQHADLHLVTRPADKVDIPLDSIRELQTTLERTALEGGARVVVIDPSDRLNVQGQNALLKTLEEPGESTFLLLTASRPESLLDTVRSRVRRVRLIGLPEDRLASLCPRPEDCPLDLYQRLVALCDGSVGRLRALISAEAREILERLDEWLAAPPEDCGGLGRALLQGQSGRDEVQGRAMMVLLVLRSRLRESLRNALAVDPERPYAAARTDATVGALERVLQAEDDLRLGIPAAQTLDALLLSSLPTGSR